MLISLYGWWWYAAQAFADRLWITWSAYAHKKAAIFGTLVVAWNLASATSRLYGGMPIKWPMLDLIALVLVHCYEWQQIVCFGAFFEVNWAVALSRVCSISVLGGRQAIQSSLGRPGTSSGGNWWGASSERTTAATADGTAARALICFCSVVHRVKRSDC